MTDVYDALSNASAKLDTIADSVESHAARQDREIADLKARLAATRAPSKALLIGGGPSRYEPEEGAFLKAVMQARSHDAAEQAIGKATLDTLTTWQEATKASLGSTDATGGWILPNAIVDEIIKPAVLAGPWASLMQNVSGVTTASIDMPYRDAAPARATIVNWGAQKPSVDLAYQGYSATMWTLARIHDVSKQFLTKSAGAAEADVLSELSAAFARGVSYYLGQGGGTTEPYGLVTALVNSPATFTTAHTAAAGTVAGSVSRAIGAAASALMGRGFKPTAVVMGPLGYSEMIATNGDDDAGWFISGISANGTGSAFEPGTLVSPWGLPVYVDPDFPSDDMVVADFRRFRYYTGAYRVDSSDVANTRWDFNLVGFRGEMELAFDARPGVYSGAAQYVADILS